MTTLEELQARKETLKNRLMDSAAEFVELVVSDVPAFMTREVRKVFVSALDFSESLNDEALKALKAKIRTRGAEVGVELVARLADESLWLHAEVPSGELRTLETNAAVWDVLQTVARATTALMLEEGFPTPEEGFGIVYKTPTWFIDGKYAPALIEKVWSSLVTMRHVDEELEATRRQQRQDALQERWDKG